MIEIIWSLIVKFKLGQVGSEIGIPEPLPCGKSNSRKNKTGKVFGGFTLNSKLIL